MLSVLALAVKNAMVTASSIAEPDTTETAWSSSELVVAGAERIIATPSATVTMTIASPCVVTYTGNGLAVDTEVVFTNSGGALPTGITAGETYYILARTSVDTFTLKDADGRTINTSGSQSGTHTCTANVHKVYQAAVGYSTLAITAVDTSNERMTTASAHGFTADQAVMFTTTGTLPAPLAAGTVYYVRAMASSAEFTVSSALPVGPNAVDITTTGSGTHSVHYVSASVAPNYNKPPGSETSYWTLVGATNKWAMFDAGVSEASSAASPITLQIVPGEAWNGVAWAGLTGCTAVALRLEINRATVTFTAATDKVNWTGHGLAANTPVSFTNSGGALPTEVVSGTVYYVKNPGANDFEISATAGGATIDITGAGTGTHTGGQVAHSSTTDPTTSIPAVQDVVSEANEDTAAYQDGTLFVTLTGPGTIECKEFMVGDVTDFGTTVNDINNRIRNYSLIERDAFGNPTITARGYTKELRAQVLVDTDNYDSVADYLAEHKDDYLLIIASTRRSHAVYGLVTDWEMGSDSLDYSVLSIKVEGLLAT